MAASLQPLVCLVSLLFDLPQVRDLGKGALLRQEGAGMKPGQRDLESWAKSDLDVMEDSQGNTVVKGLTFVEVQGAWELS
jgi:hypothetical protein